MPIPILSVADIRASEAAADANGLSYADMMERAGRAIAERIASVLIEQAIPQADWLVWFLIGPGNNGGDGLVAGRVLASEYGAAVHFLLLNARPDGDPLLQAVQDAGLPVHMASEMAHHAPAMATCSMVVDALFGIGARLPLDEPTKALLTSVKTALTERQSALPAFALTEALPPTPRRAFVLAVDCPSGLDCDLGALDEAALHADETITMIAAKPGLLRFPGAMAVGRLTVADLGVPEFSQATRESDIQYFTAYDAAALLPPRPANSHKGTFGRVLIVGGSANYPGAPALAAQAAYRGGAGLVTVGVAEPLVEWLAGAAPECTWLHLPHELGALTANAAPILRAAFPEVQALVLGMGLGRDPETAAFLERLLSGPAERPRAAIGFAGMPARAAEATAMPPLILDADGLSLLATLPDWPNRLPPDTILTPHPGEMARLCGVTAEEVNANRWDLARDEATTWNAVLVLKGAHTVIASPDGRLRVLPFKTAALATAGTGDVLAGLIGALRAQHLSAFDAASVAAYLHGLAGVRAAQAAGSVRGIIARDVLAALPSVYAALGG